jgi:hypothetical protein
VTTATASLVYLAATREAWLRPFALASGGVVVVAARGDAIPPNVSASGSAAAPLVAAAGGALLHLVPHLALRTELGALALEGSLDP